MDKPHDKVDTAVPEVHPAVQQVYDNWYAYLRGVDRPDFLKQLNRLAETIVQGTVRVLRQPSAEQPIDRAIARIEAAMTKSSYSEAQAHNDALHRAVEILEDIKNAAPQAPAVTGNGSPAHSGTSQPAVAALIEQCREALAPVQSPASSAIDAQPGRIPELEETRIRAEYWANAARTKAPGGETFICAMEAANAWKNAAYAAWDKIKAAPSHALPTQPDVPDAPKECWLAKGRISGSFSHVTFKNPNVPAVWQRYVRADLVGAKSAKQALGWNKVPAGETHGLRHEYRNGTIWHQRMEDGQWFFYLVPPLPKLIDSSDRTGATE